MLEVASHCTLTNCTLQNNSAHSGGAISVSASTLNVHDSAFIGNCAKFGGGAIIVDKSEKADGLGSRSLQLLNFKALFIPSLPLFSLPFSPSSTPSS